MPTVTISFNVQVRNPHTMTSFELGQLILEHVMAAHIFAGPMNGVTISGEVLEAYQHQIPCKGKYLPWILREVEAIPKKAEAPVPICGVRPGISREGEDVTQHYCILARGHGGEHLCKCTAGFRDLGQIIQQGGIP